MHIDLGLRRFLPSLRRSMKESFTKQYYDKRDTEGGFPTSLFNFNGLQFRINYDAKYMVSFVQFTIFSF